MSIRRSDARSIWLLTSHHGKGDPCQLARQDDQRFGSLQAALQVTLVAVFPGDGAAGCHCCRIEQPADFRIALLGQLPSADVTTGLPDPYIQSKKRDKRIAGAKGSAQKGQAQCCGADGGQSLRSPGNVGPVPPVLPRPGFPARPDQACVPVPSSTGAPYPGRLSSGGPGQNSGAGPSCCAPGWLDGAARLGASGKRGRAGSRAAVGAAHG